MKVSEKIFALLYLTVCVLVLATRFNVFGLDIIGGTEEDLTASRARDLRAEARYHLTKANEAMDKMFEAEEANNVDDYADHLQEMRREDMLLVEASNKYDNLRDYLEAKIWQGKIKIENFNLIYEKSTGESILDHLLFRVQH